MSRKKVKLILLIAGILIIAAGFAMFTTNLLGLASQEHGSTDIFDLIFVYCFFAIVSFVLLSVASLMH